MWVLYIGDVYDILIGLLRQPSVPSQKESYGLPTVVKAQSKTTTHIFMIPQHVTRYRSVISSLYIVVNEIRTSIDMDHPQFNHL